MTITAAGGGAQRSPRVQLPDLYLPRPSVSQEKKKSMQCKCNPVCQHTHTTTKHKNASAHLSMNSSFTAWGGGWTGVALSPICPCLHFLGSPISQCQAAYVYSFSFFKLVKQLDPPVINLKCRSGKALSVPANFVIVPCHQWYCLQPRRITN